MKSDLTYDEWIALKRQIKNSTGFVNYENQAVDQPTWYGTSDKFDEFKSMIGTNVETGNIAYVMDTGKKYMYSEYKNDWYAI